MVHYVLLTSYDLSMVSQKSRSASSSSLGLNPKSLLNPGGRLLLIRQRKGSTL